MFFTLNGFGDLLIFIVVVTVVLIIMKDDNSKHDGNNWNQWRTDLVNLVKIVISHFSQNDFQIRYF